jgi:hypothetical protein
MSRTARFYLYAAMALAGVALIVVSFTGGEDEAGATVTGKATETVICPDDTTVAKVTLPNGEELTLGEEVTTKLEQLPEPAEVAFNGVRTDGHAVRLDPPLTAGELVVECR